jgi:hypothetical protein
LEEGGPQALEDAGEEPPAVVQDQPVLDDLKEQPVPLRGLASREDELREIGEHALPPEVIKQRLETGPHGLKDGAARPRRPGCFAQDDDQVDIRGWLTLLPRDGAEQDYRDELIAQFSLSRPGVFPRQVEKPAVDIFHALSSVAAVRAIIASQVGRPRGRGVGGLGVRGGERRQL